MTDQEFARRWATALRSGKYRQATGWLRSEDGRGYCCMGVAADLIDPEAWETPSYNDSELSWHGQMGELPPLDLQMIGLTAAEQLVLINLNDNGRPFGEIADKIEQMAGIGEAA